jgi:hypothetical protein
MRIYNQTRVRPGPPSTRRPPRAGEGYDAEEYIALLSSFSGHIAMADWQRERLFGEIRRRLALRPGGRYGGTGEPCCT